MSGSEAVGVDVGELRQLVEEGHRFVVELGDCVDDLARGLVDGAAASPSFCVAPSSLDGLVSAAMATNRAVVRLLEDATSADAFFLSVNLDVGFGGLPVPSPDHRLGELIDAVASASGPFEQMVAMAELNDLLAEFAGGDADTRSSVGKYLVERGLGAQASVREGEPGDVAATALVSEGIGLLTDADLAALVQHADRLELLIGALDLGDERVPVLAGAPPSQNSWLWRVEAADRLLSAVIDEGGWLGAGGEELFTLMIGALSASGVRLDASSLDADGSTRPGHATVRAFNFRETLRRAVMADNVGLGAERAELAVSLAVAERVGGVAGAVDRELLLRSLPSEDQAVVRRAMAGGALPGEALRLADAMKWPSVADERVELLRWLFPVDDFGNTSHDLAVFELEALQGVQLAQWMEAGDGTVPEPPLSPNQIKLVAGLAQQWSAIGNAIDDVAQDRWGNPLVAIAESNSPGSTIPTQYEVLGMIAAGELATVDGRPVSPGLLQLSKRLVDPGNERVWSVLAAASGDGWFGGDGSYQGDTKRAERLQYDPGTRLEADVFGRLAAQTSMQQLFGPHALAFADADGNVTEGSVNDWLDANEGQVAPIVIDRLRAATHYGFGEDTFGWDEIADGLAIGGITAFAMLATLASGGYTVPAWAWYSLEAAALAEAYAAHQSGDTAGAVAGALGPMGEAFQFARKTDGLIDDGFHAIDDLSNWDGYTDSDYGDALHYGDHGDYGGYDEAARYIDADSLGNTEDVIDEMVAAAGSHGPGLDVLRRERAHEILSAALARGLNPDDAVALVNYTGTGYQSINAAMRSEELMADGVARQIESLEEALDKLPVYEGAVYSGMTLETGELEFVLRSGGYSDKAFRSASVEEHVALGFVDEVEPGRQRVLMEFESQSAFHLGNDLAVYSEAEVLFPASVLFELVEWERLEDGTFFLRLVEVQK